MIITKNATKDNFSQLITFSIKIIKKIKTYIKKPTIHIKYLIDKSNDMLECS